MDIIENLAELDDERLAEYATEVREAFDEIAALDTPTDDQLEEAEKYADHLEAIQAQIGEREAAVEAREARIEALRNRFKEDQDEAADEADTDDEADVVEGEVVDSELIEDEPEVKVEEPAAAKASTVTAIARKTKRPPAPVANRRNPVTITAAADVPEFSTGSRMEDIGKVGNAVVNRMRGFGTPHGDGMSEDLHKYGVASFALDFEPELTIDRGTDDMEVLYRAMDESRLPGGSLTASGGWCAPSETLYDLCAGETTEGILSVPEVNVARGGIRYTSGVTFSDIYTNVGFCLTEAQAIAGTDKTCYEVPCPTFVEVRLDACGLCIKVPILTNAAYPELVQRWISGSMIAHQHKMNAKVLTAMATAAGTAKTVTGLGSTTQDTLSHLELIADDIRSNYRLSFNQSMEVVLPFWVRAAIRNDLANRQAVATEAVSDADIAAHFSARHLNVQFVYDWQDTAPAGTPPAIGYPTTFQALIYPAGTFIKGTSDVINLSAVYDAASLVENIYTGLFFEQGILVAKMCYEAQLVTLPVCGAGRTGAANFTCA